jgi:hypothetical protein
MLLPMLFPIMLLAAPDSVLDPPPIPGRLWANTGAAENALMPQAVTQAVTIAKTRKFRIAGVLPIWLWPD